MIDLHTLMGSERQRAALAKAQRQQKGEAQMNLSYHLQRAREQKERRANEERGRALLQELRNTDKIDVLIHDVDIPALSTQLREQLMAEIARHDFDFGVTYEE